MALIKVLGEAYAAHSVENPEAFRLMFEIDQPERPSQRLIKVEHRAFNTLWKALDEAVVSGHLNGDSKTLAHLYWASLHGVVVLDMAGKLANGRSKKKLIKSLLDGVFTSASS